MASFASLSSPETMIARWPITGTDWSCPSEIPVDRGPDDQGTVFRAASGLIEVLRLPRLQEPDGVWDYRAPQGAWIVVEADDVDAWYGRVVEKGLPIKEPLMDQEWGHRSFRLVDPDGIELFVFSNINV